MKAKKIVCAALAASMALLTASLLGSCGGGSSTAATITTVSAGSADIQTTTSADPLAGLTAADFGGKTFTFLDRDVYAGTYWGCNDIYAENETGESLNDAVFKRNSMVQDRFNVVVKEDKVPDAQILNTIQKVVQSGSNDIQAVNQVITTLSTLAVKGMFLNLADLPVLDLSQPCWDGFVNNSVSINHRNYFVEGDLNVGFNDASWIVMFNKTMANDLGLDSQYQEVTDGAWTLDYMHSNCKLATKDLNGDGKMDDTDQYGATCQYECMYSLYASTGQYDFTKDSNDLPVCAMDATAAQITILQNVWDFLQDKTAQIKADDYYTKYPQDPWTPVGVDMFRTGRALYYIAPVELVSYMRGMDADFGLLPMPKSDVNQNEYYDTVQYNNTEFICVPTSNTDADMAGTVLQAMGLASTSTVKNAYYDVQLKTKYARDDDSASMLDIIFKNRIVDLGLAFDWGGCYEFYTTLGKAKSFDYASAYAKISKKVAADMSKTVTAFTAGG